MTGLLIWCVVIVAAALLGGGVLFALNVVRDRRAEDERKRQRDRAYDEMWQRVKERRRRER